ncbi:MAG: cupin domain-containing protein [Anaerolineae bacterium]
MLLAPPHLVDTNQIEWEEVSQPWYSKPIRRKVLRRDPDTGRTHLLITYPAGLNAPVHRHSFAHTIFILENELVINGVRYGPGTYAHFPAGESMSHTSTSEHDCTFLIFLKGCLILSLTSVKR